jgi:indole-3-glycerol phosphate synthase
MERARRFERPTSTLARLRSTPELRPHGLEETLLVADGNYLRFPAFRKPLFQFLSFFPDRPGFEQKDTKVTKKFPTRLPLPDLRVLLLKFLCPRLSIQLQATASNPLQKTPALLITRSDDGYFFMNKLDEIIATKRLEVEKLRPRAEALRLAALERNDFRSFFRALDLGPDELAVIAEVKKASPSVGVIMENFDPVLMAKCYDDGGANAISVLTDEQYFQGHLSYLARIRAETRIPLLRKDFIVDEIQIYESVVAGADAILLIVAALTQSELVHLLEVAEKCQLDVLVEVHDEAELERALDTEARIIGVNNRNLKSFLVDLGTTERLSEEIPDGLIFISESGIKTPEDARRVFESGANGILVGESLMRAEDPGEAIAAFHDCVLSAS